MIVCVVLPHVDAVVSVVVGDASVERPYSEVGTLGRPMETRRRLAPLDADGDAVANRVSFSVLKVESGGGVVTLASVNRVDEGGDAVLEQGVVTGFIDIPEEGIVMLG